MIFNSPSCECHFNFNIMLKKLLSFIIFTPAFVIGGGGGRRQGLLHQCLPVHRQAALRENPRILPLCRPKGIQPRRLLSGRHRQDIFEREFICEGGTGMEKPLRTFRRGILPRNVAETEN